MFDSNGKEVEDVGYPIDDPPPLSPSDFVLLNPGEFFGERIERAATTFVKKPGDYEFLVEYTSYLPEDRDLRKYLPRPDVPFWSDKRGKLRSNRIKLRITE